MENESSKSNLNQTTNEQIVESSEQKNDNQQKLNDSYKEINKFKYQPFEKTTYWNHSSLNDDGLNQSTSKNEISECLLRIEAKLISIEKLLKK